jgi:glycosyltransferase involved in cell wall biosynthesis
MLGNGVEFVGEIAERDKQEFLGNALALLFPIDWPEPFGLVMIEAMACGTPVIAYPNGSVPEILQHAVSGCLVETEEQAVEAARRMGEFDRAGCRRAFEERFTAERMAHDYVHLYRGIHQVQELARRSAAARAARRAAAETVEPPALLGGASALPPGLRTTR